MDKKILRNWMLVQLYVLVMIAIIILLTWTMAEYSLVKLIITTVLFIAEMIFRIYLRKKEILYDEF